MGSALKQSGATFEDWLACPADARIELIRGSLVEKPEASPGHSLAQIATGGSLRQHFQRRPGGQSPGGWWFFSELPIRLGQELFRPDVCGYRRERMPAPPRDVLVVELAPDWVCELLSPSNKARDRVEKLETYFRAGVPHYWLMDPEEGTLEVFRRTEPGYTLVLSAKRGQHVRAEPFDAIELRVDELFGADPED